MIRVKICGITNEADALTAIEAGADALGFIFTTSPRQISPTKAQAIVAALPPLVQTIGVFRNQPVAEVKEIVEEVGLGGVQLHGDEDPNYCLALRQQLPRGKLIKALAVKDGSCLQRLGSYKGVTDGFLLDAYSPRAAGGTGETFNWQLAQGADRYGYFILAGGLNIHNVRLAIDMVKPAAIDVCSGVERAPGQKDREALFNLIRKVKMYHGKH